MSVSVGRCFVGVCCSRLWPIVAVRVAVSPLPCQSVSTAKCIFYLASREKLPLACLVPDVKE